MDKQIKLHLLNAIGYFVATVVWLVAVIVRTEFYLKIICSIASVCFLVLGIILLCLYIRAYKEYKQEKEHEEMGAD